MTVWEGERPPTPPLPLAAGERETLYAFLDLFRAALIDRAWGLDSTQLRTTHPPTSLSLARLIGHMAYVERFWFEEIFAGATIGAPWAELDWDADRDAEMALVESWPDERMLAEFEASVTEARNRVAAAESLDDLSVMERKGNHYSLRWIVVHMIEEYARHCGHADLIREAIDGDTAT